MSDIIVKGPTKGPFSIDEVPVAVVVNGKVTALVVVDTLLTSEEIIEAYSEWTGFDPKEIKIIRFGHNILTIKRI